MIYQFEQFELDMARFELREEGAVLPLEPQVFTLLAYLIEHRERLVPKNELFEKIWVGRVVTDSALTSRIKSARQVLGDSGKAQQFIKTIHGKGFRFVADVRCTYNLGSQHMYRFNSNDDAAAAELFGAGAWLLGSAMPR